VPTDLSHAFAWQVDLEASFVNPAAQKYARVSDHDGADCDGACHDHFV